MKWVEYVKIIGFCILAACVYGVAHDLVTAHVCVGYFLPPIHPIIVPTDSPLLLALIWGVIATWWVGLFLGILLAVSCRVGNKPKLSISQVVRPVLYLLISLFIASMFFGLIGYAMGQLEVWFIPPVFHTIIKPERLAVFQFNAFAHFAAYLLGLIGGVIVTVYSIRCRFAASPKRLVLRWVELFNKANASDLAELYHDNAVNHQIANEPVEGKENIRNMFEQEFAAAEMVCIVENLFEDGEWAILEWKDPLGLRGCGFFHVTDRKIKFQRGYWDKLSFLRQHGLPIPAE